VTADDAKAKLSIGMASAASFMSGAIGSSYREWKADRGRGASAPSASFPPSLPPSRPPSLPPSLSPSLPVLTHPLSVDLQPQAPLSLAVQRTILSREDEAEEVLRKGGRAGGRDGGRDGGRQEGTFQGEKGGAKRGNVTRREGDQKTGKLKKRGRG